MKSEMSSNIKYDYFGFNIKDAISRLKDTVPLSERDINEMTNQIFDNFMDTDCLDLQYRKPLNPAALCDVNQADLPVLKQAYEDYRETIRAKLLSHGMRTAIDIENSFNFYPHRLQSETGKLILRHLKS